MAPPLVVLDTNVLVDMWLSRGVDQAVLLLNLAEVGKIELATPEFVLLEFRGTALRLVGDILQRRDEVRKIANDWSRSTGLDLAAESLRVAANIAETRAAELRIQIDPLIDRVKNVAHVPTHTLEIHFQGELRFLQGNPPARPRDGIQDCRIFEGLLALARSDAANRRPLKVFATSDSDYEYPELREELKPHGFVIRSDLGKLYGELR